MTEINSLSLSPNLDSLPPYMFTLKRDFSLQSRMFFVRPILRGIRGNGPMCRRIRAFSSGADRATPPKPRVWPFYFFVGSAIGGGMYLLGRKDGNDDTDGLSYVGRSWKRLRGFFTTFEEPAFEKLLPDPVVDPQNPRPYTLKEQGRWRIAKRPGAELFLFYAAQLYEVVVFSSLPQHEGDVIVKKLDPYGCISYSLYRFATRYKNGTNLKDISHLNRDMSKILVLGHDNAGFAPHLENFIRMDPWMGSVADTVLEDTIDFLEMVAFSRLSDVRQVSKMYQDKSFPEAFEMSQEEAFRVNREAQKGSIQNRISGWLSLGRGKGGGGTDATTNEVTYRSRKLERTEMRRKEYTRIKELMQKQLQAEMDKEKEYYAEHKMALWDLFTKGPPPPPPPNDQ